MKRFFITWAIIGIVLRLLVGATTFHEDIRAFDLGAYLVSQKGMVLSLYDYLATLPADHPFQASYGAKGPAFFNYLTWAAAFKILERGRGPCLHMCCNTVLHMCV